MGGINIPLQQHQVLFDCLASYEDYKDLKKAIIQARPGSPTHTRIRLHHHDCTPTCQIRIDPIQTHYLIGAWQIPENLVTHPTIRWAQC